MARRFSFPLLWLAALHLGVIGASFFAPYDFAEQNRSKPFSPPTRIHILDAEGHIDWPYVCQWNLKTHGFAEYEEDCGLRFPIRLFADRRHLFGVDPPASIHLMGTDNFGRDQFSRLLHGGGLSLLAGLSATAVSMTIALLLGTVAGYYQGWVDHVITGVSELVLSLPWLFLLIAVRASLPLELPPNQAFLLIAALIGAIGWARPAQLVRAAVLSGKERGFVRAARGFGAGDPHIIRIHVVPQCFGIILTHSTLLVPRYILAEVTLSFVGLGIAEPSPSWGATLATMQYAILEYHWWLILPVIPISFTFLAYISLTDTIQRIAND
jgi:peptide/nickel transport system permease protein